ncbi:MAG: M56 family metallopeptidase [Bacteroidales bacterium]|nr:M56 family metallopeptidase [Bacteroidales bacterium]
METIGTFLFFGSIYLLIAAFVYAVFVRRMATPSQARFYLITGMIASVLLSAISLVPVQPVSITAGAQGIRLPEVVVGASEGIEYSRQELIRVFETRSLFLYLTMSVSLLLLLRMVLSTVYLLYRVSRSEVRNHYGTRVIPLKGDNTAPFSFFSYVFIPEALADQDDLYPVIMHERGHAKHLHTIDLIFVELLRVIFWFHPAVWYARRELKLQHEYEADRYVLHQDDVDKVSYQKLLLQVNMSGFHFSLTTPFTYPPLKKRIMMMNKKMKKSPVKIVTGMLMLASLFAGVFLLQSCDFTKDEAESTDELVIEAKDASYEEDVIFTVVEEIPKFPGGTPALMDFIGSNIKYPEAAKDAGIQGTVFVSFVVEPDGSISNIQVLRGIGGGCDEEAVRVVGMMPKWEPGRQRGEAVRVQFNLPVRFALNQETAAGEPVLPRDAHFYLDGKLYSSKDLEGVMDHLITPDEIESIDVIAGEIAMETYGKERVLVINRKEE